MPSRTCLTFALLLCGWTTLRAETVATEPEADLAARSARFLEERIDLWQKRLKLDGWKISAAMTKRADLKARTVGGIRWDKAKKTAVISVLDPSEYQVAEAAMRDDMEFTVVHELVHLRLASLPKSDSSRSTEEAAVNSITEALIALDRH